jgi:hypothetical protein
MKNLSNALPHFPTAIAAAESLRAENGDGFATADEMIMLADCPDYLIQVLEGYHGVKFIVDEYAAQEQADADRLAAELAERNAAAACPAGFVVVTSGPIVAGDFVWNRADGGFEIYNVDDDNARIEFMFLVCRPETVESFNFEIYTKNPDTGETGWDIKHVVAFGVSKAAAIGVLKTIPNFDCVITSTASYNGMPLTPKERELADNGRFWYPAAAGELN